MEIIPVEAVFHIFSFLKKEHRFDVMLVCKHFLAIGRGAFVPSMEDMLSAIYKKQIHALKFWIDNGILDPCNDIRFFRSAMDIQTSLEVQTLLEPLTPRTVKVLEILVDHSQNVVLPEVLRYFHAAKHYIDMLWRGKSKWHDQLHQTDVVDVFLIACDINDGWFIRQCLTLGRLPNSRVTIENDALEYGMTLLAKHGNIIMFEEIAGHISAVTLGNQKQHHSSIDYDSITDYQKTSFVNACIYQHAPMVEWMIHRMHLSTLSDGVLISIVTGDIGTFRSLVMNLLDTFRWPDVPPYVIYMIYRFKRFTFMTILLERIPVRSRTLTEEEIEDAKSELDNVMNYFPPGMYKVPEESHMLFHTLFQ